RRDRAGGALDRRPAVHQVRRRRPDRRPPRHPARAPARRAGPRPGGVMGEAETVVWHDLECGGYTADLALWRELAAAAGGAVLELGAGTGRVAVDLARRGHEVIALDLDPSLLAALEERARAEDLAITAECADARSFDLGRRVALCVAPMQIIQLLGGEGRRRCLDRVHAHLEPGGRL